MTTQICFSCELRPQKYITGFCEECHQIANAETKAELDKAIVAEQSSRRNIEKKD